MFMGEFKHSIDAKGRLTIPSKIRNQCQGSVYVARGFDGCLAFYTKEEWDPFCAKLLSLPSNKKEVRKAIRFTIIGFFLLAVGFIGSKFVLEMILNR